MEISLLLRLAKFASELLLGSRFSVLIDFSDESTTYATLAIGSTAIAVDPIAKVAYVVDSSEKSIRTLNLEPSNSSLANFASLRSKEISISGAGGALALDALGKRLFVADALEGAIYEVSMQNRGM